MDLQGFWDRYNREAEADEPALKIQKALAEGKATALYCGPDVSLLVGTPENMAYCQVICSMTEQGVLMGLQAYCFALSALTGCTKAVRRGWLERLGLFDGRIGRPGRNAKMGTTTAARGWEMSAAPMTPAKTLMSYIVKQKNMTNNPRRGVTNEGIHDHPGGESGDLRAGDAGAGAGPDAGAGVGGEDHQL
jgi:hypothetical protein